MSKRTYDSMYSAASLAKTQHESNKRANLIPMEMPHEFHTVATQLISLVTNGQHAVIANTNVRMMPWQQKQQIKAECYPFIPPSASLLVPHGGSMHTMAARAWTIYRYVVMQLCQGTPSGARSKRRVPSIELIFAAVRAVALSWAGGSSHVNNEHCFLIPDAMYAQTSTSARSTSTTLGPFLRSVSHLVPDDLKRNYPPSVHVLYVMASAKVHSASINKTMIGVFEFERMLRIGHVNMLCSMMAIPEFRSAAHAIRDKLDHGGTPRQQKIDDVVIVSSLAFFARSGDKNGMARITQLSEFRSEWSLHCNSFLSPTAAPCSHQTMMQTLTAGIRVSIPSSVKKITDGTDHIHFRTMANTSRFSIAAATTTSTTCVAPAMMSLEDMHRAVVECARACTHDVDGKRQPIAFMPCLRSDCQQAAPHNVCTHLPVC